ncbi:ABC transporter [Xylariaceae sp. FL1272]|nr:ABC transporter [Xylariaceae sp. FL1272]
MSRLPFEATSAIYEDSIYMADRSHNMAAGFNNVGGCTVGNLAFGFSVNCAASSTTSDFPSTFYRFIYWLWLTTTAIFVPLCVCRILHLSRRPAAPKSTSRGPAVLAVAKLLGVLSLVALRLALLVTVVRHPDLGTALSLASTVLNFSVSILLVVVSPLEHFRAARASITICSYLFLTFVYDLTRLPGLWASPFVADVSSNAVYGHELFARLFTAAVVLEFIALVLESWSRQSWIAWNAADHSPEEASSVFSLGLYSWLIPMLWKGYHAPLAMKDLYPLDRTLSIAALTQQQQHTAIPASVQKSSGISAWQLTAWVAKLCPWALILPIFPRLLLLAFTLSQPLFLQRLLDFLASDETDSNTSSTMVAAVVFIYSGIAVSNAFYWYYQERFQSRVRALLIHAVYNKATTAPHVGAGDDAAITLMGTDVERVYSGTRQFHEFWASIVQIAIASWLLYEQLGLAFLAPLIVVLLGFGNSFYLSKRAVTYQAAWMTSVQSRISVTSSFLSTMKDLRFSGMARPAAALVQRERQDEICVGERARMLTATSASLSLLPAAIAPPLAFAFGPRVLDEASAYTSLSLLALLTVPLMTVLQTVPILAASVACLRRIKLFLIRDQIKDPRIFERAPGTNKDLEKYVVDDNDNDFVSVQDGAFSWTADRPILHQINLSLPKSSITFVVGPVGVGKSTLCRALLGEVPWMQGRVALKSDKIGYCDQEPFLLNVSVKDNIVGVSPFNPVRYSEAIRAAMLVKDLNCLPDKDTTVIGTKGLSLSGGQRQRISLARALYLDADILIFDDIFSGLDALTQEQVCTNVFGPNGLLRTRGTTVILCTHSTRFLAMASSVVAISPDGTIVEHAASVTRGGSRGFDKEPRTEADLEILVEADGLDLEGDISDTSLIAASDQEKVPPQQAPRLQAVVLPGVDLDVYRHWLSTIGVFLPIAYLIFVIGVGFFENFPTVWVKLWSEDSTSISPQHSFGYWIGIYAFLGAGIVLCVFPAGLVLLRYGVRLSGTELHHAAVTTIMDSSLRFLTSTDTGKVLNLFSQDMNILDTQLPRMMNNMSFSISGAIGEAVVIALASGWLALSYPFFLGLLWCVQRVYLPTSKRLRLLDLEAKAPLYTNFLDTVAGLPTIRAFGWISNYQTKNDALLDDSQRPSYLLAMAQQWLMLTMNVIVALIAVILVALATQLGSNAGSVGAGLVTLIALGSTLTTIVVAYTGLETSLGAITRLKKFGEETELESKAELSETPLSTWPSGGRVEIRDVYASYDGTNHVLKGLNLTIEPGEKIALCGRTGSGKSSVLALLTRLIDPMPGTEVETSPIIVDGLPLNTINHAILRERIISASQQSVFLPSGTSFRTNLDPWRKASEVECMAVLADVDLAIIVSTKGGLDASVSEANLSTGQKQLFNLARVVLRRRVKLRETDGSDGGLLILDEITSSTDADTTQRVKKLLKDEFGAYTVIMVTHHREMAMTCDRVFVLDAGAIGEEGKPAELEAREDSWFRRLFGP